MIYDLPPPPAAIHCLLPKALFSKSLLAIIDIPPKTDEIPYQKLPFTPEDADRIAKLINTVGDKSKWELLERYNEMQSLGNEIRQRVHPLKFIVAIFSHQELIRPMREILKDHFKRVSFMDGIEPRLNKEDLKGVLKHYFPDFCKELAIPEEKLLPFFQSKDWEGLLYFLVDYPFPPQKP